MKHLDLMLIQILSNVGSFLMFNILKITKGLSLLLSRSPFQKFEDLSIEHLDLMLIPMTAKRRDLSIFTISTITRAAKLLLFISLAMSSFCPRFEDTVMYRFDLMLMLNNCQKIKFFDV